MEQYDETEINNLAIETAKLAMEVKQLDEKQTFCLVKQLKKKLEIDLAKKEGELRRAKNLLFRQLPNVYPELKPRNDDAYNEALQNTWLYICQNIHRYDGKKPLIQWIRVKLKYGKTDQKTQDKRKTEAKTSLVKKVVSADAPIQSTNENNKTNILDRLSYEDKSEISDSIDIVDELKQVLLEDPEGIFEQEITIRRNCQINYRAIALKRLDDIPWKEIMTDIKADTVTPGEISRWYKNCHIKFLPKFKQYIFGK